MKKILTILVIALSCNICLGQNIQELANKAENGDAKAMNDLGDKYYYGKDIPQDYQKAYEWYAKASEKGYAEAMYNLGYLYFKGQGVSQTYQKALEWYAKAAAGGNANAMFELVCMYYQGQGVPQNYQKAFEWCSKGAEKSHIECMFNLGLSIIMDLGCSKITIKPLNGTLKLQKMDIQMPCTI